MPIAWRAFVEMVGQHQSFVLTSHQRPDCDALGSEIAMAAAIESLGKQVRIVNADPVPANIAFIDPTRRIQVLGEHVSPEELLSDAVDLMMVLDTSAWQQLGTMAQVFRESTAAKVVIDHHIGGDDLDAVVFKDDSAEANGRLVLDAIAALGVAVTEEMAHALFAAIATDTGWFRFQSVSAATYSAVAKLVDAGADPAGTFAYLYEQNSLSRLKLQGRILQDIQVTAGGRFAHAAASLDDLAATEAETSDTEDVVNRLLTIAEVEVAALLVQLEPELTKISLRCRGDFDVRAVAEQFGGGGHRAAAGLRIAAPVDQARRSIVEAIVSRMYFD